MAGSQSQGSFQKPTFPVCRPSARETRRSDGAADGDWHGLLSFVLITPPHTRLSRPVRRLSEAAAVNSATRRSTHDRANHRADIRRQIEVSRAGQPRLGFPCRRLMIPLDNAVHRGSLERAERADVGRHVLKMLASARPRIRGSISGTLHWPWPDGLGCRDFPYCPCKVQECAR